MLVGSVTPVGTGGSGAAGGAGGPGIAVVGVPALLDAVACTQQQSYSSFLMRLMLQPASLPRQDHDWPYLLCRGLLDLQLRGLPALLNDVACKSSDHRSHWNPSSHTGRIQTLRSNRASQRKVPSYLHLPERRQIRSSSHITDCYTVPSLSEETSLRHNSTAAHIRISPDK